MITSVTLHNFKCFTDQRIAFAPLTLLVGENAAGKSSVIQALLLLRQSFLNGHLDHGQLVLNGDLTNVGTVQDAYSRLARSGGDVQTDGFGFAVETNTASAKFLFDYDPDRRQQRAFAGRTITYPDNLALFGRPFNYLNAERIGPRLLYPIQNDSLDPADIGAQGQYAVYILARAEAGTVIANDGLTHSGGDGAPNRSLKSGVNYWMRTIIPNFSYQAQAIENTDQASIQFSSNADPIFVRPSNIGFGLICTLPIVVAALVAPAGSLLIVENPEAHLHPRGQSQIGKFLARVAAAGVQVVIETHSDHVLNGIRVAVREEVLNGDSVSIQYFRNPDAENPTRVITPRLYPSGGIQPRPEGFFDQLQIDLAELL